MKIKTTIIGSSAFAAAFLLLFGEPSPQTLSANNSQFSVFTDTDNDGVDDALEARWGTSDANTDSDGDLLTDLDEILLGTDPLEFDDLIRLDPPQPTMRLDSYAVDGDLVIQIMTLQRAGTNRLRLYWADQFSFQEVPGHKLSGLRSERKQYSSIIPNYSTQIIQIVIPRAAIESLGSAAIAVEGFTDGVPVGDQLRYSFMNNALMEWRSTGVFSRYNAAASGGGGLFPVDPHGTMPGEITPGEVCVQTLQEVASIGNGQKLYQVGDSYCDYLPTANCFVGCGATIGDTVVGIDVVGLLAN
ncbi:MAG: hypothetical protein QGF46_03175 [Planctomycetota bacterium]|nr:hypothetical protein [Planctomycetota bacterium]